MIDDLPSRLREAERLRALEQKVGSLSVGGGAGETTQVEDDDGQLRYEAGLLSDGSYGIRVYDSTGQVINTGGGPVTGGSDDQTASQVPFTPAGTLSSTNVQQALEELDFEKAPTGDATSIPFGPAGNLAATNVDAALKELDTEKAPVSHSHPSGTMAEVLWEDNDWSRFGSPIVMHYDTGATYTPVIQSDFTGADGGSRTAATAVRRGRVERSGVATTGGNTRLFYPLDETAGFVDGEVQVMFYGHTNPGQMGLFLRESTATSGTYAGRPMAYVVWFDALFFLDAWVNNGVWSTSGSGATTGLVQVSSSATDELKGLNYRVGASAYSRSGTTLTLSIPGEHRIQVGDAIDLFGSTVDANNMTVTSLFGVNTVIATHPTSGTASGGACTVRCRRRTMPSFLKVRIKGNTIWGKAWREGLSGTGEPDWGDPRHSWRWVDSGNTGPTAGGKCGLFVGHLLGGGNVEFGSVKVTAF